MWGGYQLRGLFAMKAPFFDIDDHVCYRTCMKRDYYKNQYGQSSDKKKGQKLKKSLKKSLGQNFLRDESVIDEIIATAKLVKSDVVFEVGPGDGALTQKLLDTGVRVVAIETDNDLIPALHERFKGHECLTLLHEDIRTFNLPQFLQEQGIASYKVVANIPYYITSMIIRLFLESQTPPEEMTIMVQKEVAQRIVAGPGDHTMLSLSVQYFGKPMIAMTVPAEAFEPVPQVDSAVLHIAQITPFGGNAPEDTKAFFRIVRAGFSAKRKKLMSNISNSLGIDKNELTEYFTELTIGDGVRAQEIDIEKWKSLAKMLCTRS